ncbi:MAG: rhodanese-like domain-containing protein [Lachnospiraceae bacterium]|nr:rhodanese-like domain-containing protein [Lachnospiraceae bacterium]
MGILDRFINRTDINAALRLFRAEKRAVLLDVRTLSEFAAGHIPRSRNLPLDEIEKAESAVPDKSMPVYVYCQKGGRASKAADKLKKMGYTQVINIGGIEKYTGKQDRVQGKNKILSSQRDAAMKAQMDQPWNKKISKKMM